MPLSDILTAVPLNIDWQQILLHLLNFLILAVGLTLLVYRPVKKFLEKRKKHFEDREKDADEKKRTAENMKSEYEEKLGNVDGEIEKKRLDARREAEESARITTERADEKAAAILSHARSSASAQKRKLLDEAGQDITDMVVSATEKLLGASQSTETDTALYDKFVKDESVAISSSALGDEAERKAALAEEKAEKRADELVSEARRQAKKEAEKILDAARSGIADAVALAAEKIIADIGTSSDGELYDKFLAEAARSERK